ncbi:TraV family lipoprotein [Endozoicomonas sp. G2_2]|uniref:TraV family lipoprotein n=1 Tax=Endozoicomonas sp. G2_2 TaxID=2821092 RepID=UPI001ADC99FC|nr:TraV family lipoprotein [Endozoicomonas sp. G2_2]MBO9471740.1 TraV family lipoprotein [Endozoicomonas sp. G2_2]
MSNKTVGAFAALTALALLTGCASKGPTIVGPSIEEVYSGVTQQGARDTVRLVREGLQAQAAAGTSDPVIPIRQPETVMPIWIPPYIDKATGRRVDGHWQYAVIKESQWQLDY